MSPVPIFQACAIVVCGNSLSSLILQVKTGIDKGSNNGNSNWQLDLYKAAPSDG